VLANHVAEPWLCTQDDVGVPVSTLDDALQAIAAIRARGHRRVVAKQAHGLAGQSAIRLWEPEILEAQRRWLEHALAGGLQLVIEPWMDRELDFSIQMEMGPGGLKLCGYTGLINDLKGQFEANWTAPDFAQRPPAKVTAWFRDVPDFLKEIRALYDDIRMALEIELERARYLGPIGIDAFVYRTATRDLRLKPIVEINPRYTMGRLTIELMKRTCPGSYGLLRLVNPAMARSAGHASLVDYARALRESCPVRLAGEPVSKIYQGIICLNEPRSDSVSMGVFTVARTVEEVLPDDGHVG
jgi:hypothetical protein